MNVRQVPTVALILAIFALTMWTGPAGPRGAANAAGELPGQSTTLLSDGRVLVLGGRGASGPTATVNIVDSRTGNATALPPLSQGRAWHTATVLPDGTVLVFGGVSSASQPVATAEVIDPTAGTVTPSTPLGLVARSGHTATVLTDGRVLVAGGDGSTGTAPPADLWDPVSGSVTPGPTGLGSDRTHHTATLLPDGSVLLAGGTTRAGAAVANAERFDPATASVTQESAPPALPSAGEAPQVVAAIPASDAADVPGQTRISLRVSKALDPASIQGAVTLLGPNGPEAVTAVAAEGGRLLFVTPTAALAPGATYSVTVNGAQDTDGQALSLTSTRFTTAGTPVARPAVTAPAIASAHQHGSSDDPDEHSHLPKVRARAGQKSDLDDLD